MKRLHVHVAVEDLARSIGFYSTLFGAEPFVLKNDYAKWMLDDPRVNFAISDRASAAGVDHLARSIGFYSTLFGAEPVVLKNDYAKWMLDDPRVNFAISDRASAAGVDHLGIQVDSGEELAELAGHLKAAGEVTRDQEATTCCYARSDKAWVNDPNGLRWETFFTFGAATNYGEDEPGVGRAPPRQACRAPAARTDTAAAPACC